MPDNKNEKTEPFPTVREGSLNDKFNSIGQQIVKIAVDFTTLNVTTLTGHYDHIINTKEQGGKNKVRTKFHDFTKELGKPGAVDARIKLVAHTHVDFDHDTINFVSENVDPNGDFLFDLHSAALNSAKSSRSAFIRMLKEFVR